MLKRFLAGLLVSVTLIAQAEAATYLVSKSGTNGYAVGVDTNNGTSTSTPLLTIAAATAKCAAGGVDTVVINPGAVGSVDTFAETTSLDLGTCGTVTGDPTIAAKPIVQSTGSTQIVTIGGDTYTRTLALVKLDAQSTSAKKHITLHAHPDLHLQQVDFVNAATNGQLASALTGKSHILLDRSTADGSNAITATSPWGWVADANGSQIDVRGGSFTIPTVSTAEFYFTGNQTATFGRDVTGAEVQLTSAAPAQIKTAGTLPLLTVAGINFTGAAIGVYLNGGTVTKYSVTDSDLANTTAVGIQGYGFTSSSGLINGVRHSGTFGLVTMASEFATNQHANGNTFDALSGAASNVFSMATGAGQQMNYNVGSVEQGDNLTHVFHHLSDGWLSMQTNIGASTGSLNLGDVTNDTHVDAFWTTLATSSTSRLPCTPDVDPYLSKQGSPTGTITATLRVDNAGNPGTAQSYTATYPMASLTTTPTPIHFAFTQGAFQDTAATKYHLDLSSSTTDASNYVKWDRNGSTTVGSAFTSADGSTWTAQSSVGPRMTVYSSACKTTSPQVSFNTVSFKSNLDAARELEGIQLGSTYGPQVVGNRLVSATGATGSGPGYGILFKNTTGPAIASGNLITSYGSAFGGLYCKAATGTPAFVHNVVVLGGTATGGAITIGPDSLSAPNGQQCAGLTAENNVLITGATAYPYFVLAGSPTITALDYQDLVMAGTAVDGQSKDGLVQWQGLGYDAHSITADPRLPNETNPQTIADITPPLTSPLISAGAAVAGALDISGSVFSQPPNMGAVSLVSLRGAPLQVRVSGASAVYAILRNTNGLVWNTATGAFETYQTANLASYAVQLTQQGTGSGVWVAAIPAAAGGVSPPAGNLLPDYRQQVGGAPAESDTIITATGGNPGPIGWNGSGVIPTVQQFIAPPIQ